ncbi:MAG: hypothetical protein V1792_15800 [Pseudomonadota bacterium]
MDGNDQHFWMAIAAIAGLVFALLVFGPIVTAYSDWKTKRAFRKRREAYEKSTVSRLKPNA